MLAVERKNIEREKFDGSLAKCYSVNIFPRQLCYTV